MRSPLLSRVALVLPPPTRRATANADQAEALVRAAQASAGGSLSVHRVAADASLPATLEEAMAGGPDLLVVGGGDGATTAAADRVAGTSVALGALPLGPATSAASTLGARLGLPRDLSAAVDALISGRVVPVDLGRAGRHGFLDLASVGLPVDAVERTRPSLTWRLGPAAPPLAALAAHRAQEPFAARLEFPDGDHDTLELEDLLQLVVATRRRRGHPRGTGPTGAGGLLDVHAVERGRLRGHLAIARQLHEGHVVRHDRVHHLRTARVRLVTRPGLPVTLDGMAWEHTPLVLSLEPRAVRLVVPADGTATKADRASGGQEVDSPRG